MPRAFMRRSVCPANRMIDERRARRTDLAHNVMSRADDQCGNTARFDHVSDETHGLMTEGSVGDEQGEVDLCLHQLLRESRSESIFNFLMFAHAAHEGVVKRREAPDGTFPSQCSQCRARKDDFRILFRHSPYARVMIDNDRAAARIRRHAPVTQVFARNKRFLVG
jgi:hypothetical protein